MVIWVLRELSFSSWQMDLTKEGIQQTKEALEITARLGDTMEQARCLINLARLLCDDKQFNAAEGAALRAMDLFSENGNQHRLCVSHRVLGEIYQFKGEAKKAIQHFEAVLGIAPPFDWREELFWAHYHLAWLLRDECRFDDANAHIERAKSHTVNSAHYLGLAMDMQAGIWYKQHRFEETRSEALRAAEVYERLGAATRAEGCRMLLQYIEEELDTPVTSGQ